MNRTTAALAPIVALIALLTALFAPGNRIEQAASSVSPLPSPVPTVFEVTGTPQPIPSVPPYGVNELRRDTIHNLLKGLDQDGDGVSDADDNCVRVPNPNQKDRNKNGIGDACEVSRIAKPHSARARSTPRTGCTILGGYVPKPAASPNPQPNEREFNTVNELNLGDIDNISKGLDHDCDSVSDFKDNCVRVPNPNQKDRNKNGIGDACESRELTLRQRDIQESKTTVIKAMRDFGRTLDFGSSFGKPYVKDRPMRALAMRSALRDEALDDKTVDKLKGKTLERAYFAQENYGWLMWAYFFQEDSGGRLASVEFVDVQKRLRRTVWRKLNARQRLMYRQFLKEKDLDATEKDRSFTSRTELMDWIGLMEHLGVALRSIVPDRVRKQFQGPLEIEADLQAAGDFLGLQDRESVYVSAQVKGIWAKFTFKLVREQGAMRIFSTFIHDGPG